MLTGPAIHVRLYWKYNPSVVKCMVLYIVMLLGKERKAIGTRSRNDKLIRLAIGYKLSPASWGNCLNGKRTAPLFSTYGSACLSSLELIVQAFKTIATHFLIIRVANTAITVVVRSAPILIYLKTGLVLPPTSIRGGFFTPWRR